MTKSQLLESNYILDACGDQIAQVDEWINQHLTVDVDYTYMLMDVFPPKFRYYFRCPQNHLMALLKS